MNYYPKKRAKATKEVVRPGEIHHIIKANFKKNLQLENLQHQEREIDNTLNPQSIYREDSGKIF